MLNLSEIVLKQKRSGIREIVDLSQGIEGVFHMEIGEPLFQTPEHIINAGCAALKNGFTKYTPNAGFLSLRKAAAERLNRDYDLCLEPENIVVTTGGVEAIASTVRVMTNIGDEVLIPDPGWPNYQLIIASAGAVPVQYTLKQENGYLPDIADIEARLTDKSKVLVINTPSNPLGVVFPDKKIKELVDFAKKHNLFIISDEVYEKIVYDGKHATALKYNDDERIVAIYTMSKSYAMTGWRVGYAVAAKSIATQLIKMQEAYVSCTPSVSQKAAEAALNGPQDCITAMLKSYKGNKETAERLLDSYRINYFKPSGAFYLWINAGCDDSTKFAKELLREKKVAIAPGSTFGPSGREYIRISLASSPETIEKGVKLICEYIKEKDKIIK